MRRDNRAEHAARRGPGRSSLPVRALSSFAGRRCRRRYLDTALLPPRVCGHLRYPSLDKTGLRSRTHRRPVLGQSSCTPGAVLDAAENTCEVVGRGVGGGDGAGAGCQEADTIVRPAWVGRVCGGRQAGRAGRFWTCGRSTGPGNSPENAGNVVPCGGRNGTACRTGRRRGAGAGARPGFFRRPAVYLDAAG